MTISNIDDIDYYPELDPIMPNKALLDPSFNVICDRIKTGL
jgi:hypothetical protein